MNYVFETTDKTGRKIHLSKERWSHIRKKHPEIEDIEALENTLTRPDKITEYDFEEQICYYFKHMPNLKTPNILLVIVKYLNGKGCVVPAYLVDYLK